MNNKTFLSDLGASFVVFFVALPLALGIALASGAPSVLPGLISCAVGGIIVGVLSGAPLQVSGPAAGLTVIVFELTKTFGWETTCAITACAGGVQILLARAKLGKFCLGVSPAVVHGMLAGIGLVIALAQIHVVLGGKPQSSASLNVLALPAQFQSIHSQSLFIGLITIGLLSVWRFLPRVISRLPAALIVIIFTTGVANILLLDVPKVTIPEELLPSFSAPQLPSGKFFSLITAIFSVAIVASIESLLCAVATDRLHNGEPANLDKELTAQGIGNVICGLLGGLPVTGVIIRSSANVKSGAQTRASTIMHGFWIVLLVALASQYLELIPLPVLAGLLVYIGIGLVNLHHIKELREHKELPVYIVTLLGVTFWNLLGGVFLGIAVAIVLLIKRSSSIAIDVEKKGDEWLVSMAGTLSFLAVPQLRTCLARIPAGVPVLINSTARHMDHAVIDTIQSWQVSHESRGGKVSFAQKECSCC
jgi:carbonic anhydrase